MPITSTIQAAIEPWCLRRFRPSPPRGGRARVSRRDAPAMAGSWVGRLWTESERGVSPMLGVGPPKSREYGPVAPGGGGVDRRTIAPMSENDLGSTPQAIDGASSLARRVVSRRDLLRGA